MSCTAYIVYTFHPSLHKANFGQFMAKQVLLKNFLAPQLFVRILIFSGPIFMTKYQGWGAGVGAGAGAGRSRLKKNRSRS